jgi:hypothetical protein
MANAGTQPRARGALLRREGWYSSPLVCWRRQPQPGILQGLAPPKRSSKSRPHPREQENQKLGRQNQRLAEALRKAASIIDLQQK